MTNKTNNKTAAASQDMASDAAGTMQDATARMSGFVADGQKNMTEAAEKMSKGFEGMSSFGQDNAEAVAKSSEIAAKAMEGIGSEVAAYSKKTFEDGVAAAQDFASARTMTELFEKQTAFAQTSFEGWLQQTTKMNEIMVAAAKDMSAPIGKRMSAAQDAAKGFSL